MSLLLSNELIVVLWVLCADVVYMPENSLQIYCTSSIASDIT